VQCINSIDRALLNEGLIEEAASHDNIQMFFDHKVITADFDTQTLVVRDISRNTGINVQFDFCVGADGSYSVIRRQLMRVMR
jgi:kynurenine 3-monooxygenase